MQTKTIAFEVHNTGYRTNFEEVSLEKLFYYQECKYVDYKISFFFNDKKIGEQETKDMLKKNPHIVHSLMVISDNKKNFQDFGQWYFKKPKDEKYNEMLFINPERSMDLYQMLNDRVGICFSDKMNYRFKKENEDILTIDDKWQFNFFVLPYSSITFYMHVEDYAEYLERIKIPTKDDAQAHEEMKAVFNGWKEKFIESVIKPASEVYSEKISVSFSKTNPEEALQIILQEYNEFLFKKAEEDERLLGS